MKRSEKLVDLFWSTKFSLHIYFSFIFFPQRGIFDWAFFVHKKILRKGIITSTAAAPLDFDDKVHEYESFVSELKYSHSALSPR
jgi:hypothetical protein